ncbi:hypothetical protein EYZ11_008037 [Aspergillus tanneri]|uniref:Uncharacterized protein n=1 Tax=Aspergillus tanneri TaxID=1220188 RepID=A0A4S3JBH6_9EURO|nr:hypothetical protein EYZ11_008037 [Aspergillus tanneri]
MAESEYEDTRGDTYETDTAVDQQAGFLPLTA